MDIRDVKDIPESSARNLQEIYRKQCQLLDHYTKIEKLPKPPLSLHEKEDQLLLKDFLSRIVEELGEAYESYEKLLRDPKEYYVWNFYEELSDALHFTIEALIYTNIFPPDIAKYLKTTIGCDYVTCTGGDEHNVWKGCFAYSNYRIRKYIPTPNIQLIAGLPLHTLLKEQLQNHLWKVTYEIQLTRNALKNKGWKQTQVLSDVNLVREQMIKSFLTLIDACHFIGIDEDFLFELYCKKNVVNNFRITSKY